MMYSRAESICEQKYQKKRLMVVDPSKPEKGVFAALFKIPTECACSLTRGMNVFAPKPLKEIQSSLSDKGE